MIVTGQRILTWGTTRAGFRYCVDAWVVQAPELPWLLHPLVVHRSLKLLTDDRLKAEAQIGRHRWSTHYRLFVSGGLGCVQNAPRMPSWRKFNDLRLVGEHHFSSDNPLRGNLERIAAKIAAAAVKPVARLPARIVNMPGGWYVLYGDVAGPFASKQDAQCAARIVVGEDAEAS